MMLDPVQRVLGRRHVSRVQNYKDTFSSPHGQAVLKDLISTHQVMKSSFSSDPLEMARMEGERNVVLRILSIRETDTNQIQNLIREANDALQINEDER